MGRDWNTVKDRLNYWWRRFRLRVLQTLGLTTAAVAFGLVVTFVWLQPDILDHTDLWKSNRTASITFLDAQGEVIGARGGLHTLPLPLADIPDHLKQAFLMTEDRRFYDHGGIDWWGITRAMWVNIKQGRFVQGGSTITQQLAKNIFLTQERTLTRKIREAILARQLEERLTKEQILELYLNRIYLGAGAFGVEAAAQTYFNKSAHDVTLAEAAMLAGLAKAPSRYAPTNNLELAQKRSRVVLSLLRETGTIAEEDYALAYALPATLAPSSVSGDINYFLDYVAGEVTKLITDPQIDLIVSTTLDPQVQAMAEKAVREILDAEGGVRNIEQAALVSFSTDGALRAMVGGRDYANSQFNRAVQARRQPGSAFKPFVYLTALENGMTPDTIYYDEPVVIDKWRPNNYAGGFGGRVTLMQAMESSINTVAVQVAEDIGRDNIISTARRLGVTSALTTHPSLALGASEVTLWELTNAYLPFANQGLAKQGHAIKKIESDEGQRLYTYEAPPRERVIDRKIATEMTHMMYQVILAGTGKRAAIENHLAAGKTGTSQDWRDAWFMGYTGQMVTGVWVGNDDASPMNRVTGGNIPAEIWHHFMATSHANLPSAPLPGATPARNPIADQRLKQYFSDIARQFSDVRNRRARKKKFWFF